MAVMTRPPGTGGNSGIKVALVAFVVLTVASLTGTVIMYTYLSDKVQAAADAGERAGRAEQRVREVQAQLREFARMAVGEDTDELPAIRQSLTAAVEPIVADPKLRQANIPVDSALLTVLAEVYRQYQDQSQAAGDLLAERDQLRDDLQQMSTLTDASRQEFADKIEELQGRVREIEQQAGGNQEAWDRQVTDLTAQLDKASESAGQQLGTERQQRREIEKQLTDAQQRVQQLVATLASFRPRPDLTSALQIADGRIVRAVAGDQIVYISLGRRDGVKRGMTFAVYSRTRGIPEEGKGKATIEVSEIFETTSECHVTSTTPGDPILESDVIANPVFDRSRKYNFLVAGDFDLNFDDQIDDPGGEQVKAIIREAGGNLVDTIDTRTDFVVLGIAPAASVSTDGTETAESQELTRQREARRKAFDVIAGEARSLSIPVLTRTQFLHFIGMHVPPSGSADEISG
ncbi:MAG: hypothetical protein GXY55_19680 [Phycisphaerae bacterium]|nr:hypothetical protein [Phycisphaerae bacterium]